MKRTALIIIALTLPLIALSAEWKVIERSDKKAPEWLGTFSDKYLIVEVERPNLEEAQIAAEQELARHIISAVAINVTSDSRAGGRENMNGDSMESSEYFSYDTQTASARLPFMKGVSIAKALDTYWEKREEKKSKRRYVMFTVQYPLSKSEINDMHTKFVQLDNEKTKEFDNLKEGLPQVESSREIQQAIAKLIALQEYFFDKTRLADAKGLEKSYRDLYKGLTLQSEIDKESKKAVVRVLLNGKPFKCTAKPTVTSNCAGEIAVSHSDDGYSFNIYYNDEYCLKDEENWLDFNMRIEGARLSTKIYF